MMNLKLNSIFLIGFFTIAIVFMAQGQEQPSLRKRAQQYYDRLEYFNAAQLFERLVDVKKPRTTDFEQLAESYFQIGQYELAENWYARVLQHPDVSKESLWNYAEVLKVNGKYAEAKKQYEFYREKYGSTADLEIAIAGADSAQVWMANPSLYQLQGENTINTDLNEFGAVPTSNGAVFVAEPKIGNGNTSGMTGQAYLRIFSASRSESDGTLSYPLLMEDKFNDAKYHVGPITTNESEDILYITRTYPGKQVEKYRKNGARWLKSNLELKIYVKNGNDWDEYDFPYNNVEQYSVGHAALNSDGKVLYFASDMPGGYGGVDIWYSELQTDGSWGSPANAGNVINSSRDEVFPSVFNDTLYYSSDGFAGMGGLDIYKAIGSKSHFANRQNLGYPLNSAADDFGFVVEADTDENNYGYLSSNRKGGIGGDDIYSFVFKKPKITITLRGLTKDKETHSALSSTTVTLLDTEGNIVSKKVSNQEGEVEFTLDKLKVYKIYAEKSGYFPDSLRIAEVETTRDTTIDVTLLLQQVHVVGTKIVLENIYYDFDKHHIRPDAAIVLDEVVRVLRDNPTLKIELSSHTDSRGSDSYNMKLSQRRAQSAVDYIISRGIARDRLVAKGYGETRLINRCKNGVRCSEEEHQANRRTEIEVLEF